VTERDWSGFEQAELTDCSPNGVGILFNGAMPPGKRFLLKLVIGERIGLIPYSACHCEQRGDKYQIGAKLCHDKFLATWHQPEAVFQALVALAAIDFTL
jgi:hypothetical protein